MPQPSLRENLSKIQERVAAAAHRAGRRAEDITLIGVSKTHPAEAIQEAYEAGMRHFGENRVQEWEGKRGPLSGLKAMWHLIGHLQSNKAGRAASLFDTIDSIDDAATAQRLDRSRGEAAPQKKLRVLLEVRISGEETKSGLAVNDLERVARAILALPRIQLAGLMCVPPFLPDAENVRPYFSRLRALRDELQEQIGCPLPTLSMGMSHDFEVAVEEGATEVRVGTALFGSRGK